MNEVINWIEAHATLVQAVASAVSVLVTIVLAWIAWRALGAAGNQAEASREQAKQSAAGAEATAASAAAAARSADELRRQGQLNEIPLLRAGRPEGVHRSWDLPFVTIITIENVSDVPAIATYAQFYGVNSDGSLTFNAMATSLENPMLGPGQVITLGVASNDIHGMTMTQAVESEWRRTHVSDDSPPHYTYDRWVVRIHCDGVRGAHVEHEWRWHANFERQDDPQVWQQARIVIEPDPEHPEYRMEIPRPAS